MGDCVINTCFPLLVNKTIELPAVVCVQRKAPKCVPTEDDIMVSNINSFGNAVGGVTNSVTSMFETQARFSKNSKEYMDLDYRIKCGQLYQQNSIDKTKGIVAKDMPLEWTSWAANKIQDGDSQADIERKTYNRTILTEKKPYFFKYVYSSDMAEMNKYNKTNNEKSLMRFRLSLEELINKSDKTDEEIKFIECYNEKMPLGTAPCTINKICYRVEEIFDNADIEKSLKMSDVDFDYSIMKNPDITYNSHMFHKIKKIYEKYRREVSVFMKQAKTERIKSEDRQMRKLLLKEDFMRQCQETCGNSDLLCNIVLDLCYNKSNKSKEFAWDVCGETIIENLLKRNGYKFSYPTADSNGEIEFNGMRFSMVTSKIDMGDEQEDENVDYIE